jgi:hypothetical protein
MMGLRRRFSGEGAPSLYLCGRRVGDQRQVQLVVVRQLFLAAPLREGLLLGYVSEVLLERVKLAQRVGDCGVVRKKLFNAM